MFLSKLRISAIVMALLLSAMGAGLWAQPRPAQRERDKPRVEVRPVQGDGRVANPREVHGTIKALDAGKGTITVTLIEGRQETVEKTFTLPKNVEVGVNTGGSRRGGVFREGTLNDLAMGTMVLLQLADDKQTVECILADGPTVHGTIKSVDAGKNTITVASTTRGFRARGSRKRKRGLSPLPRALTSPWTMAGASCFLSRRPSSPTCRSALSSP